MFQLRVAWHNRSLLNMCIQLHLEAEQPRPSSHAKPSKFNNLRIVVSLVRKLQSPLCPPVKGRPG